MKCLKSTLLLGVATLFFVACSNDDNVATSIPVDSGETTPVSFNMDVSAFKMGSVGSRALNPVYTNSGFTIYAFKKAADSDDFVCNTVINGSSMTYNSSTQLLSGTATIPIGTYKFLPVYGLANAPAGTIPSDMIGQVLTDDLLINQVQASVLPEIFLMDGPAADLTRYDMGFDNENPNPTVTATLKRAVARVDILFISATKDDAGNYIEAEMTDKDILGNGALVAMNLSFTNLNQSMNFFGLKRGSTFTNAITYPLANLNNRITIGSGAQTIVENDDYANFDNVQAGDIIRGSAHIGGLYFLPNSDEAETVGLTMVLTNNDNEQRTIRISTGGTNLLPLVRNMVTLVKVYVIRRNPDIPPPTVFDTNVDFEIEIDRVWLGSNTVVGELN